MELKEFAVDFLNNSLMSIESNGLTQEDAITGDLLEYLVQCGEVIQPELCHYKMRNIKINAYDYDDDNNTLDLFVTLFKSENYVAKVSDNDVDDAFKKALNFFHSVRNDKIKDKVDESFETVFELTQIIQQTVNSLSNLRIFVITNGVASPDIIPSSREEKGLYMSFQLWDIERIYRHHLMFIGKQEIEIDFLTEYNFRLKCLKMEDVSEKVDAYLAIVPATLLASIYRKYRQALLEKNVRTFLQLSF